MVKSLKSQKWAVTPVVMIYPWEDDIGHIEGLKPISKREFHVGLALEKLGWFQYSLFVFLNSKLVVDF